MAADIPEDDQTDIVDQAGEAAAYLQAMVAGKVFKLHDQAMQKLTGQATLAMIFDLAIGMEKEAILFYLGIREMVTKGKDKIDEVIREEMRHIRILTDQSLK
jgi:rubrerythrin